MPIISKEITGKYVIINTIQAYPIISIKLKKKMKGAIKRNLWLKKKSFEKSASLLHQPI